MQPVLINGQWRDANAAGSFQATNPSTGEALPDEYPVSTWDDCDEALSAAAGAARELAALPASRIADFLEKYAELIEANKDQLVEMAHAETGLPKSPRLADGELPRTTGQLRQAAAACRSGSWQLATIDTGAGIRSHYAALGPVAVFGPNNFPFAFGSVSGGDFAAAIAAGNPVIGKANSSHPGVTRLFAEAALEAARATGLPLATVQLIYRTSHADGERLVADPRLGATGYTGSRGAGLKLKAAADAAGKPIYLELSSVNPVVLLPQAVAQRGELLADEFTGSCLMGAGQFCTNPGLVILCDDEPGRALVNTVAAKFSAAPTGTLLSRGVAASLHQGLQTLVDAGARVATGHQPGDEPRITYANTLLTITGDQFLSDPETFQTEAFGNGSLFVLAKDAEQMGEVLEHLEGNLTGCIYSADDGSDDDAYDALAPRLRRKVGRLLNDKMPTGVAVSAAMNHGGPYPATGHPGFTAVGIPASLLRFAALHCYDNVRPQRLPASLADKNPGDMWRLVDGQWSQGDVA
ncbi:MAG: aldehyde dehydrogenase (NADP(+)) [Planctomycetales bacterium]|nr:aldehyde dehydrogenase (NADP(+)) [Planctomycetales bacterium]